MMAVLRWLVAGGFATVVTLLLFATMTRLVDGSWILDSLIRVFPLQQTQLPPEDECAAIPPLGGAVTIEGVVGRYRDGVFQPLPEAHIVGRTALGVDAEVEVAENGIFRFATAFPNQLPPTCPPPETVEQRLRIRASGCEERVVPVTRAWIPHRVLLDCPARD